MLLELYEFAMVFTFGTSFGCFLIAYITGIVMYFSLMSLVIDNRNNQADVGFLSSLSILSWCAFLGLLICTMIGVITRITSLFVSKSKKK